MTILAWILLGLLAYTHLVGCFITYHLFKTIDDSGKSISQYQSIDNVERKILALLIIFSVFWELLPILICVFLFLNMIAMKRYYRSGRDQIAWEKFKETFWYRIICI